MVDLSWQALANECDRDKLLEMIKEKLLAGTASPDEQRYIGRMLCADGHGPVAYEDEEEGTFCEPDTYHKLTLTKRPQGNPEKSKIGAKNRRRLQEIYDKSDPRKFVSIAMEKTGLSENTIRKHKKRLDRTAEARAAFAPYRAATLDSEN